MDWKRAKTILIIMFLVINAFLFYQLVANSRDQDRYISSQELKSIQQYLSSKNIKLDTKIPDRVSATPSLKVRYKAFEVEQVKKLFFADKETTLKTTSDGYELASGDISVEVKSGIYLIYKNHAIKLKAGEAKKEKCLSQIDRFIEGLKLDTGNRYIKVSEVKDGYMRMVLGQQYKKIPVENSQLEVIATEEGVVEATVNWFELIKLDKSLNTTTPVVALLKAYGNREGGQTTINIKQIKQQYYFKLDNQKDSGESLAIEGIAFPNWVIVSDQGQIHINAYTEEFEKIQ